MWRFVAISTFIATSFVGASRVKKVTSQEDLKTDLTRGPPRTRLTDAQRKTDRSSLSFIRGLLAMKGKSYTETFFGRSVDGNQTVDGFPDKNTHNELTFDVIVRELEKTPNREKDGTIRRLGDLGYFIFNDLLWDKDWKTFPIGADFEDHHKHRPTADKLMGHDSKAWSRELIRKHVQDFFEKRTSMKASDYSNFVTKLFHKILLDMDLSDIEIEDFASYQSSSMMVAMLPRWLVSTFKWAMPLSTAQENRDLWLEKYDAAMKKDTRGIIPVMTKEDRRFLADLLLTAMTSAGGISVPSIMGLALAVLYGGKNSPLPENERKLTEGNIRPLVYETVRRFPVVVGFPWWSPDMSKRTVLNLAVALRDPRKWSDPEEFKLRKLSEYHKSYGSGSKIGIAWAQQGKGPNGKVTPDSRGCPGQELSIVIVEEFLKVLMPMQAEWSVTEMGPDGVTITEGPSGASGFTLSRGATKEPTISDEPEQTEPKTAEEEAEMAAHSVRSSASFQCPIECQECCKQTMAWSYLLGRQDKSAFKCVMTEESMPGFQIAGRKCTEATPRNSDPSLGTSKCDFTKAEQDHEFHNQLAVCK